MAEQSPQDEPVRTPLDMLDLPAPQLQIIQWLLRSGEQREQDLLAYAAAHQLEQHITPLIAAHWLIAEERQGVRYLRAAAGQRPPERRGSLLDLLED